MSFARVIGRTASAGGSVMACRAAFCEEQENSFAAMMPDDDTFGLRKETIEEMKTPPQFERWHDDVKRLTSLQTFKGAKLDLQKNLTPNFSITHRCQLGGSPYGPQMTDHYQFGVQLYNEHAVAMSTVDPAGMVEAQLIVPALPENKKVGGKLIAVLQPDAKNDMFWVDVEHTDETNVAQFRMGNNVQGVPGKMFGVSYSQAINSRLSMSGEAQFHVDNMSTATGASAKYETPNWAGTGTIQSQPQGEMNFTTLQAQYHRKVLAERVNLVTELTVIPAALDTQFAFGAEFQLKQGTFNTAIDGNGKMASVYQAKINPGIMMSLSAEACFGGGQPDQQTGAASDVFKFGYGVQIGN